MSKHSGVPVSKFSPAVQAQIAAQLYANRTPHDHSPAPAPILERGAGERPLATAQAQAGHSGKYLVRVVSFRCRLLDEDNLCEKYHVDGLRYAGLLPSDAPGCCRIETTQQKVRTKAEERTEITISSIP
jgi:hypothetical protein